MMISGKTSSGFYFEIDKEIVEDWEFLDIMSDALSEDAAVQVKASRDLAKFMLGPEGVKRLVEHLKKIKGRAKAADVFEEIKEIIDACKVKN